MTGKCFEGLRGITKWYEKIFRPIFFCCSGNEDEWVKMREFFIVALVRVHFKSINRRAVCHTTKKLTQPQAFLRELSWKAVLNKLSGAF